MYLDTLFYFMIQYNINKWLLVLKSLINDIYIYYECLLVQIYPNTSDILILYNPACIYIAFSTNDYIQYRYPRVKWFLIINNVYIRVYV